MTDQATLQLIQRAQAGDRQAFAALFAQYKNLVYRTAFLVLGNARDAEDALQEVFVLIYRALSSFDPERAAFSTWLHRITVNQCLNQRRKLALPSVPLDDAYAVTETSDPANAEDEAIWQAVQALSDKQRAVVVLRYYWELSYAEMAQALNTPLGTIKSRLDLALKTLRRALITQETHPDLMQDAEVTREL